MRHMSGGSVSHAVRDARQYSSSPVGESTTQPPVDLSAHLEDLNVPDTTVMVFFNFSEIH